MREEEEQPDTEASLHGDVLETILTYLPLIDLVPARHVSKSWNLAVSSSLSYLNPPKPWLILHTQYTYTITTHAYDPRSNHWLQLTLPPIQPICTLRSSTSSLLYMLTPSHFSFSYDPLHLTWHLVDAPLSWRTDPVVALLDSHVIIAGRTCEFEDEPFAVELYNLTTRKWDTCDPIPAIIGDEYATSSLSITTTSDTLYVVEKSLGVCFSFSPVTKSWSGPFNLSHNNKHSVYFIGSAHKCLILIIVEGNKEGNIERVGMYRLNDRSLEVEEIIGEMPRNLVEKMKGDDMAGISVNVKGSFVFVVNKSEVFVCEIWGGACKWWSVRNVARVKFLHNLFKVLFTQIV